ncbi:hypothetical protein CUMW_230330 [Citrus unshiu]|uniref:Uncharacterized protein n=1 Tax=Citrus unshiu TaxID=55188 RepID=A0A2H5QHC4_CITUN|nr:hypothetical protein CUMW_230330 [Citrus unshiu]
MPTKKCGFSIDEERWVEIDGEAGLGVDQRHCQRDCDEEYKQLFQFYKLYGKLVGLEVIKRTSHKDDERVLKFLLG